MNAKNAGDFPKFLLVILVLHQAQYSQGFEFLPLPWQILPASSAFLLHFLLKGVFLERLSLKAVLQLLLLLLPV